MILVDKNIRERVNNGELIVEGFQESKLNSISHDLTISHIIDEHGNKLDSKELLPGDAVFIRTNEKIALPDNVMGRVGEKNSRMRQGLKVDAPYYHPGHKTYCFLRVLNISPNAITVSHDDSIAQIIFEELKERPDTPYNEQPNASFNNEEDYKGFGAYKDAYENQIRKVDKARNSLDNLTERIYANVLTLMGILVAIFSLISIDYQATGHFTNIKSLIAVNISLAVCFAVLFGIILVFINKAHDKKFLVIYLILMLLLIIATIGIMLCI